MLSSLFNGLSRWTTQILAIAVAVLGLAAAGAGVLAYWQWSRAAGLKADLATQKAAVAAYQEAAKIRATDDARRAQIDTTATERDHALQSDPGGDAPLSDYLAGAAGRLWP